MRVQVKNLLKVTLPVLALAGPISPTQASAQTYPIDCAILLCLSGGWPASVPCARARAEFIRRITPWPVEPPLQIWRCPMGASFDGPARSRPTDSIIDALFHGAETPPNFSSPVFDHAALGDDRLDVEGLNATWGNLVRADYALHLAQDRADIDISGPEFNFVRSIRVFDVRHARQRESGARTATAIGACRSCSAPTARKATSRGAHHRPQRFLLRMSVSRDGASIARASGTGPSSWSGVTTAGRTASSRSITDVAPLEVGRAHERIDPAPQARALAHGLGL